MLEFPEVSNVSKSLKEILVKKKVRNVLPPSKEHKFCFFEGDPTEYSTALTGQSVIAAEGFGIFVEIAFNGGYKLCFNDGVNVRFMEADKVKKDYQLLIQFDDGMALMFTVSMYGGIILFNNVYENEYYTKSKQSISPFSVGFEPHFRRLLTESKQTLSAKAFLATEQRFPGIGNGVLQDILFEARIHPKRKLQSLSEEDKNRLLIRVISVLRDMTDKGGRDTEKDLFGKPGRYKTKMSKNTWNLGCPVCKGVITKQAYMGGSVYYCPNCQRESVH